MSGRHASRHTRPAGGSSSLPVWVAILAVAAVIAVLVVSKLAGSTDPNIAEPGGDRPGPSVSGLPASVAQCDDGMDSTEKFLAAARPVVVKWTEYWQAEQEYVQNSEYEEFDKAALIKKRDEAFARIAEETKAQLDTARALQAKLPASPNPCASVTPAVAPAYSAAISACLQRAPLAGDAGRVAAEIVTAFATESKRQDDVRAGKLTAVEAEKQYLPVWNVSKRTIDAFKAAEDKLKPAPKCELPSAA